MKQNLSVAQKTGMDMDCQTSVQTAVRRWTENARVSARNVGIGQKSTSVVKINAVVSLNHMKNARRVSDDKPHKCGRAVAKCA